MNYDAINEQAYATIRDRVEEAGNTFILEKMEEVMGEKEKVSLTSEQLALILTKTILDWDKQRFLILFGKTNLQGYIAKIRRKNYT